MKIEKKQTTTNTVTKSKNGLGDLLTKEISFFGTSFNNKQKELFYNELSVLLNSGINLKNALELLSDTQNKVHLQEMISGILKKLVSGTAFSEIIQTLGAFTKYEYYAIKIGEQTGQLAKVLDDLSNFFKRKNEQHREVSSALTYPIIVLITSIVVVVFMLKYVVPMFEDIFNQNNVKLPFITRKIIQFSDFVANYGWGLLILLFLMPFFWVYISKQLWFKKVSSRVLLRIPIIGGYLQKIYLAQFTQAMALLTSSKVTVVESLQLVAQMIQFYPLQKALKQSAQDILVGGSLSSSFVKHTIFDRKMLALMRVAEETNKTEYVFEQLNEQYNTQVKYQSQVIANVLNPILTLLVGVIVGVILISMYLPMFQLSTVIK